VRISPALLEDYLRDHYFTSRYDLGSSGVECWSFGELRTITGLDLAPLDELSLDDSPSYGAAALREAVAARFGVADPGHVIVTHGSTEALFLAMNALLEPGDEVVTVSPAYHALWSVAEAIGCRVVPWALRAGKEFGADLATLPGLVTPRTRMVVANFPHNPTGAMITPAEQKELIEVCDRAGAYLIWDAAFAELVHDGPSLPDPTRDYERALTFGTLSKAYGLPGLRFGWCVAHPDVLASFLPLRDRLTICLSPLIEALALEAIRHGDVLVRRRLEQAQRNLVLLEEWAERMGNTVGWARPRGGVTAFPRLVTGDVDALCRRLARERGVLLVPGSCFSSPERVRLGFGGRTDLFAKGLDELGDLLTGVGVAAGTAHADAPSP
jgi:capreomycidine synthase